MALVYDIKIVMGLISSYGISWILSSVTIYIIIPWLSEDKQNAKESVFIHFLVFAFVSWFFKLLIKACDVLISAHSPASKVFMSLLTVEDLVHILNKLTRQIGLALAYVHNDILLETFDLLQLWGATE